MLKSLGQLSRKVHKDKVPYDQIRSDLIALFDQLDPTNRNAQKCLDMVANMVTEDMTMSQNVLNFGLQHGLATEQVYTAAVRSYSLYNNADLAIALVREMIEKEVHPHIRTFLPIFEVELGPDQFQETLGYLTLTRLTPTPDLFGKILGQVQDLNNLTNLIQWSAQSCNYVPIVPQNGSVLNNGSETTINERGICAQCQNQMEIVDLTSTQRERMMDSVFDKDVEPAIARWLTTRHYDIVIDGANVAHYNNSPFDLRKVINMINKINQNWDKRILLVFAGCRKKQTRKLFRKGKCVWSNVDVFYSRINTNDDLSWLYAGLYYPDIWVITNDQMRDHVYYKFTEAVGRDTIDLWMERNIIGFWFDVQKLKGRINVRMGLDLPLDWSVRPQVGPTHVHIPLHDNVWWCVSL